MVHLCPNVLTYNNTGSAQPGSTVLTISSRTAVILANSPIIIVVVFGSLRNYVIMNLLLALAIVENVYLLIIIEKQTYIFGIIFFGTHCYLVRSSCLPQALSHLE